MKWIKEATYIVVARSLLGLMMLFLLRIIIFMSYEFFKNDATNIFVSVNIHIFVC